MFGAIEVFAEIHFEEASTSGVGFHLVAALFIPKDKVSGYARDWALIQVSLHMVDTGQKGILGNKPQTRECLSHISVDFR